MSRVKNKYSSSSSICEYQRRQRMFRWSIVGVLCLIVASVAFFSFTNISHLFDDMFDSQSQVKRHGTYCDVQLVRMNRNAISYNDFDYNYNRLFADLNETHMQEAQRLGIGVVNDSVYRDGIARLLPIKTNNLYAVDYMTHSKPCLVPEAVVLLQYIGERFNEILRERNIQDNCRPIVTSAFRTSDNVTQLRRINRNASENSCHCYGTTFDISYSRFMNEYGLWDEASAWMVDALARTLYELRCEGLCYVRYERHQSCFHITVRNVEYAGSQNDTLQTFTMPYGVYLALNGTGDNPAPTQDAMAYEEMASNNVFAHSDIKKDDYTYSQYIELK